MTLFYKKHALKKSGQGIASLQCYSIFSKQSFPGSKISLCNGSGGKVLIISSFSFSGLIEIGLNSHLWNIFNLDLTTRNMLLRRVDRVLVASLMVLTSNSS